MKAERILCAAALCGLAVSLWWGWTVEQARREAVSRLQTASVTQQREVVPSPTAAPKSETSQKISANVPMASSPANKIEVGNYLRLIDELRDRLRAAELEADTAQREVARLGPLTQKFDEEQRKLSSQLLELSEGFEREKRVSEALQAELRVKSQRMIQAETAEKVLLDRLTKSELALRRKGDLSRELDDLTRRREAMLVSLQRRYQDVTDLYRNYSLSLQVRENAAGPPQAGDLSRIQSVLQQAEEDLRQLRSLSGRLAELSRASR